MWNESSSCGQSQELQWDDEDASWDSSRFPQEILVFYHGTQSHERRKHFRFERVLKQYKQ